MRAHDMTLTVTPGQAPEEFWLVLRDGAPIGQIGRAGFDGAVKGWAGWRVDSPGGPGGRDREDVDLVASAFCRGAFVRTRQDPSQGYCSICMREYRQFDRTPETCTNCHAKLVTFEVRFAEVRRDASKKTTRRQNPP
jgi:hypothetical protein